MKPLRLFLHQLWQVDDVGEGVIDEFVGPDAVPFAGEFGTLRFIKIDGEVAIESFGKRGGLVRTAGQDLLGDHRVEDVLNAVAGCVQEFEIELSVVKDLYDAFVGENVGEPAHFDAFAQGNEHVVFTVRELDRIKLSDPRIEPGRFRIATENSGFRQAFAGFGNFVRGSGDEDFHRLQNDFYAKSVRTQRGGCGVDRLRSMMKEYVHDH
jgi:hypothetical protein